MRTDYQAWQCPLAGNPGERQTHGNIMGLMVLTHLLRGKLNTLAVVPRDLARYAEQMSTQGSLYKLADALRQGPA